MAKWTLVDKSQKVGNQTVYHYRQEGSILNGLRFHMHPTVPFGFVTVEGSESDVNRLVEAFFEAGMMQHTFKGGFDEAIQTLDV